jgi:hypothetical protein
MLFWKKDLAHEIVTELTGIVKTIDKLKSVTDKKDEARRIILRCKGNIAQAEKDIIKQAEEQKEKPWIDIRYDAEIDELAKQEVGALKKLDSELSDYESMLESLASQAELDAFVEMLAAEGGRIVARDKENLKKVKEYSDETIKERLKIKSITPGVRTTKDGVSYTDVAFVMRQLGAWVEYDAGHAVPHPYAIHFSDNGKVPLSGTLGSRKLANEVNTRLKNIYPRHKHISTHDLKEAFSRGSIIPPNSF